MRFKEFITEKWSEKYKSSIDCSNPKGFSQRAHCQGRKKKESVEEGFQQRTVDKLSSLGMQGPYSKRDLVGMSSVWSKTLSGVKSSQIMVQDANNPRHSAWIAPAGGGQWMVGAETGYTIKSGPEALKRLQFFLQSTIEETIRKQGDKYIIYSKDGSKKLGTYDSRKAAEKRLGQIEYFKHAGK